MSVASWALTPGFYLAAFWISTQNSITFKPYGNMPNPVLGNAGSQLSNAVFDGLWNASTNAMPSSFAVSDTASYNRTNQFVGDQPMVIYQGT